MFVWNGYGSEHSMNLVMIGRFKEVRDAEKAKELIDQISEQVGKEFISFTNEAPPNEHRFSEDMAEILRVSKLYSIGPAELEQFARDVTVSVNGNEVLLRTDESDVSAFLKVLIDKGARVEVYSAHEYPEDADGDS